MSRYERPKIVQNSNTREAIKTKFLRCVPDSRSSVNAESSPLTFTVQELAKQLQVSERTIRRLNTNGELPRPIRIGQQLRWCRTTVLEWIASGRSPRAAFQATMDTTGSKSHVV